MNKITETRTAIRRAIIELQGQIDFETCTFEADISKNATVFVDVVNHNHLDYGEIEIIKVDVIRDFDHGECKLKLIADFIGRELDKTVNLMNSEERDNAEAWEYQQDYESICGKFSY